MFTYVLSTDKAVDISDESRSIIDRYIGRQPVDSRLTVSRQLVDSQSTVSRQSVNFRLIVSRQSFGSRPMQRPTIGGVSSIYRPLYRSRVGHISVVHRSTVGDRAVNCRWYIGQLWVEYQSCIEYRSSVLIQQSMTFFLSDDVSFKIFLSHESESLRRLTLALEDFYFRG